MAAKRQMNATSISPNAVPISSISPAADSAFADKPEIEDVTYGVADELEIEDSTMGEIVAFPVSSIPPIQAKLSQSNPEILLTYQDVRRFSKGLGLVGTTLLILMLEHGKETFYDGLDVDVNVGKLVVKYFPEVTEDDVKFDRLCTQINKAIAKLKDNSIENWEETTVQLRLYFPEIEAEAKQKRIEQVTTSKKKISK